MTQRRAPHARLGRSTARLLTDLRPGPDRTARRWPNVVGMHQARAGAAFHQGSRPARGCRLTWSVALLSVVGAWLGHFFEYIRVAGWSAGWSETTTSAHVYFFPAGIGILAVAAGVSVGAGRLWGLLRRRLEAAEAAVWGGPAKPDSTGSVSSSPGHRLAPLWLQLTVLELAIWVGQENLEAVAAGHRAPLLSVLSGVHALAPMVMAEVAFLLASVYCLICRRFRDLEEAVRCVEGFIARRWRRATTLLWSVVEPVSLAVTPFERWGTQMWQQPPPSGCSTVQLAFA